MIRIGLVQERFPGDGADGTFPHYARYAARAAEQACDVVLFPELSDTGYVLSSIRQRAGAWPGPAFDAAQQAAAAHGVVLIGGLSEREGSALYNAVALFDRTGALRGHYRKTHLFHGPEGSESGIFTPGCTLVAVDAAGIRWGLSLCFDLRFPEVYRALSMAGAEVIVNLAAWPAVRIQDWSVLCRARAMENQIFVAGVNQVGSRDGNRFGGRSCVVDPSGHVPVEGDGETCDLLVCDISTARIKAVREQLPVFGFAAGIGVTVSSADGEPGV